MQSLLSAGRVHRHAITCMGLTADGLVFAAACSDDASDLASTCGQFAGLIQSQVMGFGHQITSLEDDWAVQSVGERPVLHAS